MQTVSLFDAKIHLSRLNDRIVTGTETEIVIFRNGKPVARIVPIREHVSRRIGLAKGEFEVSDEFDAHNAEVAALFVGGR